MNDDNERLQSIVRELGIASQQLTNIQAQIREQSRALNALENQPESRAVFKQVGALLVEVEERSILIDELKETIERLSAHERRLASQEKELRETYESLVSKIEGAY